MLGRSPVLYSNSGERTSGRLGAQRFALCRWACGRICGIIYEDQLAEEPTLGLKADTGGQEGQPVDETRPAFEVVPFPTIREAAIDLLRVAHDKHMIHGFFEVDVTTARQFIRDHKSRTGERLSFTAFIVACLARAVAENRSVNAYRLGRKRLVVFQDVDVNTMVEREVDGHRMGTPNIIRAADKKTFRQIHDEIRAAQAGRVEQAQGMEWFKWAPLFARLPTFVRMLLWRVLVRNPHAVKRFAGTVGLTAVGMFGPRAG
ncbi:MAG: hypothetical protein EHM56_03180, partial [Chloroflexi bacterium]